MAHTSMTEPLHVSQLTADQARILGASSAAAGQSLVDLDGYVTSDTLAAHLHTLDVEKDLSMSQDQALPPLTVDALHVRLEQLRADIDALSERARQLALAADHVDVEHHGAVGERRAIELVDEVADVARHLRAAEQPASNSVFLAHTLTLPPSLRS